MGSSFAELAAMSAFGVTDIFGFPGCMLSCRIGPKGGFQTSHSVYRMHQSTKPSTIKTSIYQNIHRFSASKTRCYTAPANDIARQEAEFFPDIDLDVLELTIAAYQNLGCWAPDPLISRQAYDNLLEVFLHSGAITQHHPYESCVVNPPEDA